MQVIKLKKIWRNKVRVCVLRCSKPDTFERFADDCYQNRPQREYYLRLRCQKVDRSYTKSWYLKCYHHWLWSHWCIQSFGSVSCRLRFDYSVNRHRIFACRLRHHWSSWWVTRPSLAGEGIRPRRRLHQSRYIWNSSNHKSVREC